VPTSTDRRTAPRAALAALLVGSVALAAGCGGGSPTTGQKVDMGSTVQDLGPNGGPAVSLDDSTRAEVSQRSASGGTALRVTLLQPDLSSPASAMASEVSARVFTLSGEEAVNFSADPGSPNVWDSPAGPFKDDGLQGELTVVLDGRSITKPFIFR
jgi:hypothetical protein